MDGELGPQFQRTLEIADLAHINSLKQVPGGTQNSPYQDMDGEPGPQFQKPTDIASQVHISSLAAVPGGSQNSPFQDYNNGTIPPQYIHDLPN